MLTIECNPGQTFYICPQSEIQLSWVHKSSWALQTIMGLSIPASANADGTC